MSKKLDPFLAVVFCSSPGVYLFIYLWSSQNVCEGVDLTTAIPIIRMLQNPTPNELCVTTHQIYYTAFCHASPNNIQYVSRS